MDGWMKQCYFHGWMDEGWSFTDGRMKNRFMDGWMKQGL